MFTRLLIANAEESDAAAVSIENYCPAVETHLIENWDAPKGYRHCTSGTV